MRCTEDKGVFSMVIIGDFDYAKLVSEPDELIKFIHTTTNRHELEIDLIQKTVWEYK